MRAILIAGGTGRYPLWHKGGRFHFSRSAREVGRQIVWQNLERDQKNGGSDPLGYPRPSLPHII